MPEAKSAMISFNGFYFVVLINIISSKISNVTHLNRWRRGETSLTDKEKKRLNDESNNPNGTLMYELCDQIMGNCCDNPELMEGYNKLYRLGIYN
jgi:hypothetical protein